MNFRNHMRRFFSPATSENISLQPISRKFGADRGMPIDRYYIEKFLQKNLAGAAGSFLEIGGLEYINKFAKQKFSGQSLSYDASGDYQGDLRNLSSLPAQKFDVIIAVQTLPFIYEIEAAIKGLDYLLKPGGICLVTLPGICQISQYDRKRWGDYWRFTTDSAAKAFQNVFGENVEVEAFGNLASSIYFLQGRALEDLPSKDFLDRADPDYEMLIGVKCSKKL